MQMLWEAWKCEQNRGNVRKCEGKRRREMKKVKEGESEEGREGGGAATIESSQ